MHNVQRVSSSFAAGFLRGASAFWRSAQFVQRASPTSASQTGTQLCADAQHFRHYSHSCPDHQILQDLVVRPWAFCCSMSASASCWACCNFRSPNPLHERAILLLLAKTKMFEKTAYPTVHCWSMTVECAKTLHAFLDTLGCAREGPALLGAPVLSRGRASSLRSLTLQHYRNK